MKREEMEQLVKEFKGLEVKKHIKLFDEYECNEYDIVYHGIIVGSELVSYEFVRNNILNTMKGGN